MIKKTKKLNKKIILEKIGFVANSGEILNIVNAYSDDRFNKDIDKQTNYKTNTILCVPIIGKSGEILGFKF
jgi:dual 3',5'-cyclic-AMP and -GMP phosphodiesterase 11